MTKDKYELELNEELSNSPKYTENIVINGDNSIALEILEDKFNNMIKCIYIDPPYNNREFYNHYDDDKDHDIWLNEIMSVLIKLKKLMSDDGSIWISIDDNQVHYLKVAADKVFGRENFVHTIIWHHRTTRENRSIFSNNHEYILVYSKNKEKFKKARNLLPITKEIVGRYKNPDNDHRGPWQSVSAHVQAGHAVESQFYDIIDKSGNIHTLPNGRCWCYNQTKMQQEIDNNNVWFGNNGKGVPRLKKFLYERNGGITPETVWFADDVGTTKSAKSQILKLFPGQKVFDTPKPEELIKRILDIATNEGEWVLDAYLGSGTTVAVAHKMNRKYIGIEVGNQFSELVIPRLNKVVEGEDDGISSSVNWRGGGGYSIYNVKKI